MVGSVDKVAIIGTAPASRMMAPFADQSWQIWACSAGNVNQLPRVTIWFELHAIIEMMAPENKAMAEPFFAYLKEQSDKEAFQVVMQEFNSFVPKAIPFPRDEMVQLFGRNWFTSSVAYMMALAIARGAKEIGLYGVDMAADQEHYSAQRAGCTRFIEIAEERGIAVHVPFESCLKTAAPMYGYSEGTPFGRRLNATVNIVQTQYNQIVAQQQSLRDQANYFAGAMEQLRYMQRTWTDGSEMELNMQGLEEMVAKAQEATKANAAAAPVPVVPASEFKLGPAPGGSGSAVDRVEFIPPILPSKLNGAGNDLHAAALTAEGITPEQPS